MTAFRRTGWNFSLQRAVMAAQKLGKPLIVLEALRCDHPWASPRFHSFIMDGMRENARRLADKPVHYLPYVEDRPNAGKGLVSALSEHACQVVADDFPCYFLPAMVAATAKKIKVRFEIVDSNGLLPIRAASKVFLSAASFRRYVQKEGPRHAKFFPEADPFRGITLPRLIALPKAITERWPALAEAENGRMISLVRLPLDRSVGLCRSTGGTARAEELLEEFVTSKLDRYAEDRNYPDKDACSGLSPYLHFGHLSAHQVVHRILSHHGANLDRLSDHAPTGARSGWWGLPPGPEAFLDQLVTWREIGFNMCALHPEYDQYDSLPPWAVTTLEKHRKDPRPYVYSLDELEAAATHDPVWNAAQRQLVREGKIHNYLRMLWGKRLLEWTNTPREALEIMIYLNNKYALDGRDPNSYTGIFWILGRYDRPWGPERPIFGTVRYMSSANTLRKLRMKGYLERYGDE
jgi:deoxyribodipyrimidine photo-lyase